MEIQSEFKTESGSCPPHATSPVGIQDEESKSPLHSPPSGTAWGKLALPSHSRDSVPSCGPGSLLGGSSTPSCSRAQPWQEGQGKQRGREGQVFAPSRGELGGIPPSLQASISSLLEANMLNDGNDCFYCWLLCARHFTGISSSTPPKNPRKKEDPGFRVVRQLGQGHIAIQ